MRLAVASQGVAFRTLRLPLIDDANQLKAAVRFQAQEQIPMPLESAVLDHQVIGAHVGEDGSRQIDVAVVAARRQTIETMLEVARGAGLDPVGIDLAAFGMIRALAEAAPHPGADVAAAAGPEAEEYVPATLYCSLGGVTNLAIAREYSCLFSRVAQFSVRGIAEELAASHWPGARARRAVAVHTGLDAPLEQVTGRPGTVAAARGALEGNVGRLADELRLSLDYYGAQEGAAPVGGLVLCGWGSAIPGLAERLGAALGREVSTRRPPRSPTVDDGDRGPPHPSLRHRSGALAVRPINLIPQEERRADGAHARTGPLAYVARRRPRGAAGRRRDAGARQQPDLRPRSRSDDAGSRAHAGRRRSRRARPLRQLPAGQRSSARRPIASLADSRFDWVRVIRQLSLVLPPDVYLSSLTGSAGGGEGGATGVAGPSLTLSGCAPSQDMVAVFVASLKQIDGVTRVGLNDSSLSEGEGGDAAAGGDSARSATRRLFEIVVAFDAAPPSPDGAASTAGSAGWRRSRRHAKPKREEGSGTEAESAGGETASAGTRSGGLSDEEPIDQDRPRHRRRVRASPPPSGCCCSRRSARRPTNSAKRRRS